MGNSIYVQGEDKNQPKPAFRLQPKEKEPIHLEDAPDAPAVVQAPQKEQPSIESQISAVEPKPRARPRSRQKAEPAIVSGLKQVTQTTTEKFVTPTNGNGNGAHAPQAVSNPCVELINSNASDPNFQVIAIAPHSDHGNTPIPCPPLSTVADIKAWLRSKFGNGTYILKAHRDGVELTGENSFMRMMIMDAIGNPNGSASLDEDPVKAAKTRLAITKTEAEIKKAEAERKRLEDDEERARKKREKEEKEADAAPHNAVVDALKKQIEDLTKKLDKPQTSMTEELVKLSPLIIALAPLFKPKEENTTKLILDLFAKMDEREDKREERAERRDEKREEKFEKILEKIEEGKNKNSFLEEIEKFKTMSEILGKNDDDDDFQFDPAHPISSLFGGALKYGFKAIKEVSKDPNARQIMAHLAARLGKQPEEFTEQDMAPINAELEAMKAFSEQQAQLPAPPTNPPPQRKVIQLPPPRGITGMPVAQNPLPQQPINLPEIEQTATPIPVVVQSAPSGSVPAMDPPPVAPVIQSETPTTTAETPAADTFEEPPISQADKEDDLKDSVTAVVRQMILDLDAKREVCKWWDIALGEWPKSLITEFCTPRANIWNDQLILLEKYSDKTLFAEFKRRIANEYTLMEYNGSVMKFCQFVNAHSEQVESGATN